MSLSARQPRKVSKTASIGRKGAIYNRRLDLHERGGMRETLDELARDSRALRVAVRAHTAKYRLPILQARERRVSG
jgi:hypothetical protein